MVIAELKYELKATEKGYAGRTLYINLSTYEIKIKPVTDEMKEKFTGGKGFDLWLMWNSLPKNKIVKWNDPENEICIASGPLGGTTFYPGSGKSIVTTISPLTGQIIDSNVGGYYGPFLKFSGFDAIEIQGKSEKDVIVFINGDDGVVQIEEAGDVPDESHLLTQQLTKKYAVDESDSQKGRVSVVSTGPAAEHAKWGCLNFSWYVNKRKWASCKQAGRGGIGTVFKNKKLKALVCRSPRVDGKINNPADLESVREVGKAHTREILDNDPKQNEMRVVGTGHLPEIMNDFDLLPTENFRFGAHKDLKGEDFPYTREVWRQIYSDTGKGLDGCWKGCTVSCSHFSRGHVVLTGPFKGQEVIVDGPEYETIAGCGSNWGVWDPKWVLEANFYCDTYGLDTISVGTGIAFVMECYEAGILNKETTGELELEFGNAEAAMELIHQMARGEGFGVVVGQGIAEMKKVFAEKYEADTQFLQDIGMEHKGLEFSEYVTKESLSQQGGYGLTLKGPQHDEAWLIFSDIVRNEFPTLKDKAKALCWFPYWRTWFGLNGLCKLPWNDIIPTDHKEYPIRDPETGELVRSKIPKHVEWYAKYFSTVTGRQAEEKDLIKMSERVYNFQRIFNIRQGKGLRKDDSNIPYRSMGPVTQVEYESRAERYDKQLEEEIGDDLAGKTTEEKMAILRKYREERYEKLIDVTYEARGWNAKGCPTIEKVKDLGIDHKDVLNVIKPHQ
ncbi:MAG: aldehyde ferredoxin oxidoreductase family protein [Candidatus Hodarchaeales archaeon]|jgi:aldehyde:ferredoxin oxidoreductase